MTVLFGSLFPDPTLLGRVRRFEGGCKLYYNILHFERNKRFPTLSTNGRSMQLLAGYLKEGNLPNLELLHHCSVLNYSI